MAADGIGLELYDGPTLRRVSLPEKLVGGSVVARPDGQGYAVTISGDLVEDGVEPPVLLLDRTGARSAVQLGGIPPGYHVLDMGFPRRWYLGYSPTSRWFTASLIHMPGGRGAHPHVRLGPAVSPAGPWRSSTLGLEGSAPTISPDGRTLYSAHYDGGLAPGGGRLLVTDLPSGKTRRALTATDLGVRQLDDVLAQSPDGRTLAVGAGVEVVLVDTATLTPRAHLSGQGATQALAFSPDGTHLAASGDRLMVWDVSGDEPVEVLAQDGEADDPGFSRDGKTLYTKTIAGLVQAWDLAGDRRFLRARPGEHLDWATTRSAGSPRTGARSATSRSDPSSASGTSPPASSGPVVAPKMAQGRYNDIAWHPDSTILNITSGDPGCGRGTAPPAASSPNAGSHHPRPPKEPPSPSSASTGSTCSSAPPQGGCTSSTPGPSSPPESRSRCTRRRKASPIRGTLENFVPSGDLRTVWLNDAIVDYVAGTVRPMPDLGFPVVDLSPSPDGKRLLVDTGPTGVGLLDATTMKWISRPSAAQAGLVAATSRRGATTGPSSPASTRVA